MPILYSAVFRGTVNVADFSTITGNFSAVAKEYLEKAARNDGKFTYVVESTTFNFFTREGTSKLLGLPMHGQMITVHVGDQDMHKYALLVCYLLVPNL